MLPFNKRQGFDLRRFIKDIIAFEAALPEHPTKTRQGRISEETGLARDTVRFALLGNVQSYRTLCALAGWAGLYLDEYRIENEERHSGFTTSVGHSED